jgi:hypothetical protein
MKEIVNENTSGYNLDMIEAGPDVSLKSSAQSIWHWMWVCLLFVGPALLCIGEPLTFIMVTPILDGSLLSSKPLLGRQRILSSKDISGNVSSVC